MNPLLASTALLLGTVGMAFAQTAATSPFVDRIDETALRTGDLIGARIYRVDGAVDPAQGVQDGWDDVGEVSDVYVGTGGGIDVLIADVGGFLGLGERSVAIDSAQAQILRDPEDGTLAVIVTAPISDLEGATAIEPLDYASDRFQASPEPETTPVIDRQADQARTAGTIEVDQEGSGMTTQSSASLDVVENRDGAPVTPMNDQTAEGTTTNIPNLDDGTVVDNPRTPATAEIVDGRVEATTDGTASSDGEPVMADAEGAAPAGPGFVAPQIEREGYATVQYDEIVLPQIEGIDVFDPSDERIGEIGYTVNAAASGMGHPLAVLDVGGFLGLGAREVALPIEAMTFVDGEGGLRAYIDATAEQLEQLPEYEG